MIAMLKQLVGITLTATLVGGCGGAQPVASTTTDTATTTKPAVVTSQAGNQGGFGSPARAPGEFPDLGTMPVRGEIQLADNGCWYVGLGDASYLMVLPSGFEVPSTDATAIRGPDGTFYASGDVIDGAAYELVADLIPGGADGKWGNYIDFCDPVERSLAVFDSVEPGFDPTAIGVDGIEARARDAIFTTSWTCGRGWAMSTDDELVGLFIYQQSENRLLAGSVVTLPDDGWHAELVVGKHLFVNHCDDVFEAWEPNSVIGGQWPLTAGTLELLDDMPQGFDAATVRADLTGVTVETDTGTVISFGSIQLENRSFNAFAG